MFRWVSKHLAIIPVNGEAPAGLISGSTSFTSSCRNGLRASEGLSGTALACGTFALVCNHFNIWINIRIRNGIMWSIYYLLGGLYTTY